MSEVLQPIEAMVCVGANCRQCFGDFHHKLCLGATVATYGVTPGVKYADAEQKSNDHIAPSSMDASCFIS